MRCKNCKYLKKIENSSMFYRCEITGSDRWLSNSFIVKNRKCEFIVNDKTQELSLEAKKKIVCRLL